IRGNVVGRVDITLIDLIFWNELVNIDGARAFDLDGLYFLILNNHVLALCDLIAAHHVVPRDDLAGLRIAILLFQSAARFPVDPIEPHLFAERGGRIERNGARDQRKPKIALPVRTRRHWILLNNTRRANYSANFSKCLRPLSGVREPRARSSATEKQKSWAGRCPVAYARRALRPHPGVGQHARAVVSFPLRNSHARGV